MCIRDSGSAAVTASCVATGAGSFAFFSFLTFFFAISFTCSGGNISLTDSTHDFVLNLDGKRQDRSQEKPQRGEQANRFAAVLEGLRHHRISQHCQHRAGGKSLGNAAVGLRQPTH